MLSTNIENGYRARELKTIFVGQNLRYLKLIFHEPHQNQHNPHRQVGVIYMQVFG